MTPELGWGQWIIWITGVVVFGALMVGVAWAAYRASRRPPEQPSAAAHLAREQKLSEAVQERLAALNQRKDAGHISEADYEKERARLQSGEPGTQTPRG